METSFEISREIRLEQGFDLYVLRNGRVEVAVVPELGAKVISMKNLRTGREWMWHPEGGLKLFRNCVADHFSNGPLKGCYAATNRALEQLHRNSAFMAGLPIAEFYSRNILSRHV